MAAVLTGSRVHGQVVGSLASKTVTGISAGDSHMAAVTSDGLAFGWGTYKDSNGYIGFSPSEFKVRGCTLYIDTCIYIYYGASPSEFKVRDFTRAPL